MDNSNDNVSSFENNSRDRPSAYVLSFDDTIKFALNRNSNLWSKEELLILSQCTPSQLSEGSRLILSRLSLRRPKWIKSASIKHYVPYQVKMCDDVEIAFNNSLDILERTGFLEYITTSTTFETTFEAVEACFLLDDLTILFKRLTTQKMNPTNNNKPLNKEGLLEAIYHAVRTQKTLFGQSLMHKFSNTVVEVLKELPQSGQDKFRENSNGSRPTRVIGINTTTKTSENGTSSGGGVGRSSIGSANNNSRLSAKNKNPLKILRINPKVLHLLRRCQRLYQISCNAGNNGFSGNTRTSSASSSSNSGNINNMNYYATGAATANNTSAATTGFASVLQPLEFNAPLLVLFRKVCYPKYTLNCSSTTITSACGVNKCTKSRIFKSVHAFCQWEGAVELHAACLDKGLESVLLDKDSISRLRTILEAFSTSSFEQQHACSMWRLALLLVQARRSDDNTEETNTNNVIPSSSNGNKKNIPLKLRNNSEVKLGELFTSHLLAVLCMLSYIYNPEVTHSSQYDYLIKFDAGTQLAYALGDAASQCEKEGMRQYGFAILIYELLLFLPFLPHRRGFWYKRLCIDYAHLQLLRCALRACLRCSDDATVNVSDKTDLAQRATVLTAKIFKASDSKSGPAKGKGVISKNDANIISSPTQGRKKRKFKSIDEAEIEVKPDPSATPSHSNALYIAMDFSELLNSSSHFQDTTRRASMKNIDFQQEAQSTVNERQRGKRKGKHQKAEIVRESLQQAEIEKLSSPSPSPSPSPSSSTAHFHSTAGTACREGLNMIKTLYYINCVELCGYAKAEKEIYFKEAKYSAHNTNDDVSTINVLSACLLSAVLREIDQDLGNEAILPESECTNRYDSTASTVMRACASNFSDSNSVNASSTGWKADAVIKKNSPHSIGNNRNSSSTNSHNIVKTSLCAVSANWACPICTFMNEAAQVIACAICMHARPSRTAPPMHINNRSINQTSVSVAASPTIRKSNENALKHCSTANKSLGGMEVVDLLSSDDEDDENKSKSRNSDSAEINFLTEDVGNKHMLDQEAVLSTSAVAIKLPPILGNCENIISSAFETMQSFASIVASASAVKTESETAPDYEQRVHCMMLGLPARTISSSTRLDAGAGSADVDEESTDLVLLGLLPDHVLSQRVRPSLEEIIPAPPFFVVHGKRVGDPGRKGKSLFCGLNGDLVNVEDYVLQKCYSVDPDEDCELIYTSSCSGDVNTHCIQNLTEIEIEINDIKTEAGPVLQSLQDTQVITTLKPIHESEDSSAASVVHASADVNTVVQVGANASTSTDAVNKLNKLNKSALKAKGSTKLDNSKHISYTTAIDGGGWQGWHCEGVVFHSLFSLLMWDLLFTCPCQGANNNATTQTKDACLNKECNVFITPFQDAPLDLGHRSFFQNRRDKVLARITEIQRMSTQDLIVQIGDSYRLHFGENCRGIHWGISLPLLQLMAVCMGGHTVAAMCNAMAVNFKHFTGGAPDLMLVRVKRRIIMLHKGLPRNPINQNKSVEFSSCSSNNDATISRKVVQDYELVDNALLLGGDWRNQLRCEVNIPRTPRHQPIYNIDSLQGADAGENGVQIAVGKDENETKTNNEEQSEARESLTFDEDTDYPEVVQEENDTMLTTTIPSIASEFKKNAHITGLYLPKLAPQPTNITLPTPVEETEISFEYEYDLEARFIEVKGPTDSLMFRQRVWLHILNQANEGVQQALVCHVTEQS